MASAREEREYRTTRMPPATTLEGREDQMVALSVNLAEKQLRDGTASAQVITHYLKLGSTREKLEQERLRKENHLLQTRADTLESTVRVEELMKNAIDAFRGYSGNPTPEEDYAD